MSDLRTFCLRPGCGLPIYSRGLCHKDYRIAHELVKEGRTTWELLEKRGCAEPSRQEQRRPVRAPKGEITFWFLGK